MRLNPIREEIKLLEKAMKRELDCGDVEMAEYYMRQIKYRKEFLDQHKW